jgi:membrane protein YdbS with pleckstrin-like domain
MKDNIDALKNVLTQDTDEQFCLIKKKMLLNAAILVLLAVVVVSYSAFFNQSNVWIVFLQIITAVFVLTQIFLCKHFLNLYSVRKVQKQLLKLRDKIINNEITPEMMEMSLKDFK